MRFNNKHNPGDAIFRPQSKKLLDQVSEVMRYYHYSKRFRSVLCTLDKTVCFV